MATPAYTRILLKLSGEALMGDDAFGINRAVVERQSGIWISLELILTQKGVLDITVDWTFPNTWMYVYLGNTSCSYAQLSAGKCPFLLSSETKDPKPRVLYTNSLAAGTYYLVLYNVPRDPATGTGSDSTEAVALQLGLTVYPGDQRVPGGVSIGRMQVHNSQQ